jgi:hypothetical protein
MRPDKYTRRWTTIGLVLGLVLGLTFRPGLLSIPVVIGFVVAGWVFGLGITVQRKRPHEVRETHETGDAGGHIRVLPEVWNEYFRGEDESA